MKYKVKMNDSVELLIVADSEAEAVKKAKEIKESIKGSGEVKDDYADAERRLLKFLKGHPNSDFDDILTYMKPFGYGEMSTGDALKRLMYNDKIKYGKNMDRYVVADSVKADTDFDGVCEGEIQDESMAEKVRKAQEWVDYDLKHYGEVSANTKKIIAQEGLSFDKWNNQVHDANPNSALSRADLDEVYKAIQKKWNKALQAGDRKVAEKLSNMMSEITRMYGRETMDSVAVGDAYPRTAINSCKRAISLIEQGHYEMAITDLEDAISYLK